MHKWQKTASFEKLKFFWKVIQICEGWQVDHKQQLQRSFSPSIFFRENIVLCDVGFAVVSVCLFFVLHFLIGSSNYLKFLHFHLLGSKIFVYTAELFYTSDRFLMLIKDWKAIKYLDNDLFK